MTEEIKVKAEPLSQLSALDNSFFLIEEPQRLMTISGIWIFDESPAPSNIEVELNKWVKQFPVFQRKLAKKKWIDDLDFKLENHFTIHKLPEENNGKKALEEFISEKMAESFNMNRPLWHAYLIQGLNGNGAAFLVKLHHCISDGQGTIRMVLSLASSSQDEAIQGAGHTMSEDKKFKRDQHHYHNKKASLPRVPSFKGLNGPSAVVDALVAWFVAIFTFCLAQLLLIIKPLEDAINMLLGLALKWFHIFVYPKKIFNKSCGFKKQMAYSELLDLEEIKEVGKFVGATVNDVLIATLGSAVRRYLAETGELKLENELSCVIPVSVRKPDDCRLGNKVCIVPLLLPINIEDPIERLKVVKSRLDQIKNSPEIPISYFGGLAGLLATPTFILKFLTRFFRYRYHILLTNVPGPKHQISYAGVPVKEYYSFVPQPSDGGLGMCVLSYNGKVSVSINCDLGHIQPNSSVITKYFVEEFNVLKQISQIKSHQAENHQ